MITRNDIDQVLTKLASTRPAFCSEADFQLEFAWELKKLLSSHPSGAAYNIFLERRFIVSSKEYHMDVCVESDDELYLIELKYKTIKECVPIAAPTKSTYMLKDQAANDLGRYGYLKDIKRIEDVLSYIYGKKVKKGFAVILTNDYKYYQEPKVTLKTIDRTFRIHERTTKLNPFINSINWSPKKTPPKWIAVYPPFNIIHTPLFDWHKYSLPAKYEFKYLITEI